MPSVLRDRVLMGRYKHSVKLWGPLRDRRHNPRSDRRQRIPRSVDHGHSAAMHYNVSRSGIFLYTPILLYKLPCGRKAKPSCHLPVITTPPPVNTRASLHLVATRMSRCILAERQGWL